MEKDVYVISSIVRNEKTGKDNIVFKGAFRTNKEANEYYETHNTGVQTAIIPNTLPGRFNDYFDQFISCPGCDKNPHAETKAFLIREKHTSSGVDKYVWHFLCLLPDQASIPFDIRENSKDYQIIPVDLGVHKDRFFDSIAFAADCERRTTERESQEKRELRKLAERTFAFAQQGHIMLGITMVCTVIMFAWNVLH